MASNDRILVRGIPLGESAARDIFIEKGRVVRTSVATKQRADIGGKTAIIAPTLFDIQVNGAFGIDLQSPACRPEDVAALSNALAAWGVSRWVPTIITNSPERMTQSFQVLAEALQDSSLRRRIPGVHIEGPYISPEDGPRGAHSAKHVRKPSLRELDQWLKILNGRVLYVTLAPEQRGAIPFIRGCIARGVAVSLGHHGANADQIHAAADAGATLCTHLGNGMSQTINRHANPLWPQLADDRLSISLIADGHHLPADVLISLVRAKDTSRTILTSDATHVAGMPPGPYDLAGVPVELKPNGRICLTGTNLLAGSASMLIDSVRNAAAAGAMTFEEAIHAGSTIPARLFGIKGRQLVISEGKRANFMLLDRAGQHGAKPLAVFIDGARAN